MSREMLDKYDEVARELITLFRGSPFYPTADKVAEFFRSAFPPPAEDALAFAESFCARHGIITYLQDMAAEIESFAQSRVEPWREALEAFEAWWRLPNIARSVETIEPAMRKCLALLSDSPAKEDAK